MSDTSFDASVHQENRSATIADASGGYLLRTDAGTQQFRSLNRALTEARQYLGPFLAKAERRPVPWHFRVCVSAGCAFYGPNPPRSFGSSVPVPPAELLAKIRSEYKDGDGPLAALVNAVKIARAYPPGEARKAA